MSETLKANPIFSDHMVLQRNIEVPIWGNGPDGQRVVIECGEKYVETVVRQGKWMVMLPPTEAGGPYMLTIKTPQERLQFTDILFGDVWLAGGQSNMQWPLKDSLAAETEIQNADAYPNIRYYNVPRVAYEDGVEHDASWQPCHSDHAGEFSAVAYYYAKQLQESLGIPIGIIGCNFGATSASCWISEQRLREDSDLRIYLDEFSEQMKDFNWEIYELEEKKFHEDYNVYNQRVQDGITGDELGVLPWPPPLSPKSFMRPHGLYETMLQKVVPYGIKGFLFYQGESDADKALLYNKLLEALISKWREDWGKADLPFLFAQLTAFGCDGNPNGEQWAILRESQQLVVEKVPHTGMAITLDCGDKEDIHPKNKKTVGERLALVALEHVYGKAVQSSGPVLKEMRVAGNQVELQFLHAGQQLGARGQEELIGFEISGSDNHYIPAHASIEGDKIILSSIHVLAPVKVRYGWANYTEANLVNSFGLPAGPFRSHREGR